MGIADQGIGTYRAVVSYGTALQEGHPGADPHVLTDSNILGRIQPLLSAFFYQRVGIPGAEGYLLGNQAVRPDFQPGAFQGGQVVAAC